jgi:hypothetical protein
MDKPMPQLTRAELRKRKIDRRERAEACLKLSLALLDVGQTEVSIVLNQHYSHVQIDLRRGTDWTGEELHDMQAFLYEHGAKMRIRYDDINQIYLLIWPYDPEEEDDQRTTE